MKRLRKIIACILCVSFLCSVSFIAQAANEPSTQLTTREKILQMLGREPDEYVVILKKGSVNVSEDEFYAIADDLSKGTFESTQFESRIVPTPKSSEPITNEEHYYFQQRAITNSITAHTIKANTIMWYGSGYKMNKEGLLTFNISFSSTPAKAYSLLKQDGTQTNSSKINRKDYATAYIASSTGTYYPGVKNLDSASISVTGGEINCIA